MTPTTAQRFTEATARSIRAGDAIVFLDGGIRVIARTHTASSTVTLFADDGMTRTVGADFRVTVAYRKEDAPVTRETTTRMAAVVVPTPVDRDTVLRRIAREHRVDGDGVVLAAIAAAYDAGKAAAR